MIYKINNKYLSIECDILEYQNNIKEKLSMFEEVNYSKIKEIKNKIIIKTEFTKIIFNNNYYIIKGYLQKTDIYPVIYNCISRLVNNENNLLIHSTLISKNNKGLLILGNFGQGKTLLATFLESRGYEINSCDQTWIRIDNDFQSVKGSRQLIYNKNNLLISMENSSKKINIKQIVLLYGLCENGKYFENIIDSKSHYIKNIYQYASWHNSIPLLTNNEFLYNSNSETLIFLEKLWAKKIPLKIVKGSLENILLNFNLLINEDL